MSVFRLITFMAVLVLSLWAAGCATSNDSDMPWNVPQPWEGTIGLPGFTPSDR